MDSPALLSLDDSYARTVPSLSVPWEAAPAPAPALLALNDVLAAELGVDPARLRAPSGIDLLVGRAPGQVTTVAQAYAGHQFGGYSPLLGDGRALLLGEVIDTLGRRRDLHLKGSGRTPFARGGDGKAAVGPMLREYVMGEAMHALGVPTTRALSVVATGERVRREQGSLPGAILCRVASSHLRVGTFQYAAASGDLTVLRALADYAIARHYPEAAGAAFPYVDFFRRVAQGQADLVAEWMLVGFVHGVMNTDNMTISGETIDYGPCAFVDAFDPVTVFSSIDSGGRYAHGNQPAIAQWNLARLGETLVALIDAPPAAAVEMLTEVLHGFADRYDERLALGMAAKLGLAEPAPELVADLWELLRVHRVDWTTFFRRLAADTAGELFDDRAAFVPWAARREALLPTARAAVAASMNRVNPVYIPRNHRVEEALTSATQGDLSEFARLLDAVARPFDERPGLEDYAHPAVGGRPYVTYCGT